MRDAASVHLSGDHGFLIDDSMGDLDLDLVKSLMGLDSPENAQDEPSRCGAPILFSAASWFIAGLVLWALVGFNL